MLGSAIELKWNHKDLQSLDEVLGRFVRGRKVAVQAGGCLGVFAKRLAKEFEAVYTFEPDPVMFRQMAANVPATNVVMIQAALGAVSGRFVHTECSIRPNDGKTVLHEGMSRTEPGGIIPTLAIDDLGLKACDLIYLDVEGDEWDAVLGACSTIRQYRPTIVCEINRGVVYKGHSQDDMRNLVLQMGYSKIAQLRSDEVFQWTG